MQDGGGTPWVVRQEAEGQVRGLWCHAKEWMNSGQPVPFWRSMVPWDGLVAIWRTVWMGASLTCHPYLSSSLDGGLLQGRDWSDPSHGSPLASIDQFSAQWMNGHGLSEDLKYCSLIPHSLQEWCQNSVLGTQLCLTLYHPMDGSPPDSSVRGILQARILEWGAMPFPRGSSPLRGRTQVSRIAGRFLTVWATREIPHRAGSKSNARRKLTRSGEEAWSGSLDFRTLIGLTFLEAGFSADGEASLSCWPMCFCSLRPLSYTTV